MGTTYGRFHGRLDGIGHGVGYDLDASVPDGEIADLRAMLRLPVRYLEGSFAANVHVSGSGAAPRAAGDLRVPEGSYNGLAFSGGSAAIALTPGMFDARDGTLTVGTTHAQLAANVLFAQRAFALDVHSPDATLSDFDDYFDEADVLGGRGPVAFSFSDEGGRIRTDGRLSVHALRYRRLAFGTSTRTGRSALSGARRGRGARCERFAPRERDAGPGSRFGRTALRKATITPSSMRRTSI